MEDEFIAPNGTDVTDAFRMYLRPLLGSGMLMLSGFGTIQWRRCCSLDGDVARYVALVFADRNLTL